MPRYRRRYSYSSSSSIDAFKPSLQLTKPKWHVIKPILPTPIQNRPASNLSQIQNISNKTAIPKTIPSSSVVSSSQTKVSSPSKQCRPKLILRLPNNNINKTEKMTETTNKAIIKSEMKTETEECPKKIERKENVFMFWKGLPSDIKIFIGCYLELNRILCLKIICPHLYLSWEPLFFEYWRIHYDPDHHLIQLPRVIYEYDINDTNYHVVPIPIRNYQSLMCILPKDRPLIFDDRSQYTDSFSSLVQHDDNFAIDCFDDSILSILLIMDDMLLLRYIKNSSFTHNVNDEERRGFIIPLFKENKPFNIINSIESIRNHPLFDIN